MHAAAPTKTCQVFKYYVAFTLRALLVSSCCCYCRCCCHCCCCDCGDDGDLFHATHFFRAGSDVYLCSDSDSDSCCDHACLDCDCDCDVLRDFGFGCGFGFFFCGSGFHEGRDYESLLIDFVHSRGV